MKEHIDLCKTSNPDIMSTWAKICIDGQKENDDWIEMLKKNGIDAAHPDDGWVNRETNEVLLCYPQFNKGVRVGSLVALGWASGYRIVKIVGHRFGFSNEWWKFEPHEMKGLD